MLLLIPLVSLFHPVKTWGVIRAALHKGRLGRRGIDEGGVSGGGVPVTGRGRSVVFGGGVGLSSNSWSWQKYLEQLHLICQHLPKRDFAHFLQARHAWPKSSERFPGWVLYPDTGNHTIGPSGVDSYEDL